MHESIPHEIKVNVSGKVELHLYVHFDHTALAASLKAETDKLKEAVEAASKPVPIVPQT